MTGYGGTVRLRGHYNQEYESSDRTLLKPHGSLNWFKSKNYRSMEGDKQNFQLEQDEFDISVYRVDDYFKEYPRCPRIAPSVTHVADLSGIPQDDVSRTLLMYTEDQAEKEPFPCIILPTPFKPLNKFNFGIMKFQWYYIEKHILEADELLSIGFSWRDNHFNSFVKTCIAKRNRKLKVSIVAGEDTYHDFLRFFSSVGKNIEVECIGQKFKEAIKKGNI